MEIEKILRLIVGGTGIILTVFLLYGVWRFVAYFYFDKQREPRVKAPLPKPVQENYRPPRFVYDSGTHEFFVCPDPPQSQSRGYVPAGFFHKARGK